jgi:hypothetical protein
MNLFTSEDYERAAFDICCIPLNVLRLAPFFEEAFSGATCAPCSATVAAFSVIVVLRSS